MQVERICAHDITPQKFQEEYINRCGKIAVFWWRVRYASRQSSVGVEREGGWW